MFGLFKRRRAIADELQAEHHYQHRRRMTWILETYGRGDMSAVDDRDLAEVTEVSQMLAVSALAWHQVPMDRISDTESRVVGAAALMASSYLARQAGIDQQSAMLASVTQTLQQRWPAHQAETEGAALLRRFNAMLKSEKFRPVMDTVLALTERLYEDRDTQALRELAYALEPITVRSVVKV